MSSSDSEDDGIARVIRESKRLKTRRLDLKYEDDDELDIDIPQIFTTVGERNRSIYENHHQITLKLDDEKRQEIVRAKQLEQKSEALRVEMGLMKPITNSHLLNHDMASLDREMYFFGPEVSNLSPATTPKLPKWVEAMNGERLLQVLARLGPDVVRMAFCTEDLFQVERVARALDRILDSQCQVDQTESFSDCIDYLGILDYQMEGPISIKLRHNNRNPMLNILRTKVFLQANLLYPTSHSPEVLYRVLFLSMSDWNLYRHSFREVVCHLVPLYRRLRAKFPVDVDAFMDSIDIKVFNDHAPITTHHHKLQLKYMVFRALHAGGIDLKPKDVDDLSTLSWDLLIANNVYHNHYNLVVSNNCKTDASTLHKLKHHYHQQLGAISKNDNHNLTQIISNDYELLNYFYIRKLSREGIDKDIFYSDE